MNIVSRFIKLGICSTVLVIILFSPTVTKVQADKTYSRPSLSQKGPAPDVTANNGASYDRHPWSITFVEGTYPYDVYVRYGCAFEDWPERIGRYWQVSDSICEFYPKSHFNGADAVPAKPWILTYSYDDSDLYVLPGLYLPENSIKIVYSPDGGKSWTMMRNSIVNASANTVSVLTTQTGGFMIMAGFVNPSVIYNYKEVIDYSAVKGVTSDSKGVYFAYNDLGEQEGLHKRLIKSETQKLIHSQPLDETFTSRVEENYQIALETLLMKVSDLFRLLHITQ